MAKNTISLLKKFSLLAIISICLNLTACSGADGKDGIAGADGKDGTAGIDGRDGRDGLPGTNGKDGKDAVVNLDSLADAIRKEISSSLWDSVKTAPNIDTVYKNLFDQAFGEAWMDSTRQALIDSLYGKAYVDSVNEELFDKAFGQAWMDSVRQTLIDSLYGETYVDSAYRSRFDSTFSNVWLDSTRKALIDSLKQADYDSLYTKLYDSVYNDIYSQSVIRTLYAEDGGEKDEIYAAYANQYSLMYKDYPLVHPNGDSIPMPFPILIGNSCDPLSETCQSRKVMVKSWISGFTDTATITGIVGLNDSIFLSPTFKFFDDVLYVLSSPAQAQRQIEVYALENDRKILFYSESKSVTIHPMQVFGDERISGESAFPDIRPWIGAWVTPMADSISKIVEDVAKKLPNGELLVYQKYAADNSIKNSTYRVIQAVFEVLQSRNIKYIQNTSAASLGQKINYPVETLRKKQGICIETAVLFASVLERLGYYTSVIFIPRHAFVGWISEPKNTDEISFGDFDVLETTMIGSTNWTFLDARLEGISRYYDPLGDESYATDSVENIPIKLVRQFGIMPNNIP